MNKKQEMYARIEKHGERLLAIFTDATEQDAVKLCKKLRTLDLKAHKLAEDYCNGIIDGDEREEHSSAIMEKLVKLLGFLAGEICFVNGDARGYSLKIYDKAMKDRDLQLYRDMGGYGILSPDFTN